MRIVVECRRCCREDEDCCQEESSAISGVGQRLRESLSQFNRRTSGSLAVTWLPMGADGKARGSHTPTDTNTLEGRNMILSI